MGIERLVVQVSAFVVIYSALTGRSFCTASREMNDLLRRNMLERFVIGMHSEGDSAHQRFTDGHCHTSVVLPWAVQTFRPTLFCTRGRRLSLRCARSWSIRTTSR